MSGAVAEGQGHGTLPALVLVAMGMAWGITVPLSKLAVDAGHRSFGIVFWTALIAVVVLGAHLAFRGRRLPLGWPAIRLYGFVSLFGTLVPGLATYSAAEFLPAGVIAICLSLVPMMTLPLALALGIDRPSPARVAGLALGLGGVLLLILPEASLPERAMVAFVPLALIAPLSYSVEGVGLGRMGMAGLDAVQVLCGASLISAVVALPAALMMGIFIDPRLPWGPGEAAVPISGVINAVTYAAYVWLVGRAGAVFAAQVSYIITGAGVFWSMVILGEVYSSWIWAAMGLILTGLVLVRPRAALPPPPPSPTGGAA